MKARSRDLFLTVKIEGGLLPGDFLQLVVDGDEEIDGLTPQDYHLAEGERLTEAINRSWNRAVTAWAAYQTALAKLPPTDAGTSVTRERWLLVLFSELGYGRLRTAKTWEIEGKTYPISHAWGKTPIHLVGCRIDLERRTPGAAGAARTPPHSLVQEFLNRSDDHLWGFVSNGLRLRILRDNVSLTRQAYVEFDLEAMMEGEVYSDFVLFWLLSHQSRVEAEQPDQCWLERWVAAARDRGTRALDTLRQGVEEAIAALGRGFLAHPANRDLREALKTGDLSTQDYYRQLLRMVYRVLFLFVAEDRELLLHPDATKTATLRYERHYSIRRLRELARRSRGTQHADLYQGLRVVMQKLGQDDGCPELGLPALGSFLWSHEAVPDLDLAELPNTYLLTAVRELGYIEQDRTLRAIDYKNLGFAEFGSVYESLLELHPQLNLEAASFELSTAGGHERKTSGSYYTPDSLVQCLLDSALDPVLDEAALKHDSEQAILGLKVCDPAVGSGHFLIAAAHRMAKRLAFVRTGDEEPSPEPTRTALRDVIGRCLYGVDVNPMAAELCRVSLWLEALEPGKPLSFLDHHIRVGNSLLGATPELIAAGLPDNAFKPIEGDDQAVASDLKRRNKEERKGQTTLLMVAEPKAPYADLSHRFGALDVLPDDSPAGVREKAERYNHLVQSEEYRRSKLVANAWCAAFVWPKTKTQEVALTHDIFLRLQRDADTVPRSLITGVQRIARQYGFFHWHVAFPEVFRTEDEPNPAKQSTGWGGGFDIVLGNPPWEQFELSPSEFFAARAPSIARADHKKERDRMMDAAFAEDPALRATYEAALRQMEGQQHLIHHQGRYPLSSKGRLNTAPLFIDTARQITSNPSGRVGLVVPYTFATGSFTKEFFQELMQQHQIVSFYGFDNQDLMFPAVKSSFRFGLLTLAHGMSDAKTDFVFYASRLAELGTTNRHFYADIGDIKTVNPNTETSPVFRSCEDAELTMFIHRHTPVFHAESLDADEGNTWAFDATLMFMSNEASRHFVDPGQLESDDLLPYLEAKMVNPFDHRAATYDSGVLVAVDDLQKRRPDVTTRPKYWVYRAEVQRRLATRWKRNWMLVWQDVTDTNTMSRTMLAAVVPLAACGDGLPVLTAGIPPRDTAVLYAMLNSFVLDYLVRQKLGGTHIRFHVIKQLPVIRRTAFGTSVPWGNESCAEWIAARVLELTYTAWDLAAFAKDIGCNSPPSSWEGERRRLLRCELDAAFFHLYMGSAAGWRERGTQALLVAFPNPRTAVEYVLETFPIVRKYDEKVHGEYRTKRVILEIYDEMQEAIRTGKPYQTRLDPPPADPRCCHPESTRPKEFRYERRELEVRRVAEERRD